MKWSEDPVLATSQWSDEWFADAAALPPERRASWLRRLRESAPEDLSAERARVAPVVVACQEILCADRAADQEIVLRALSGIPPFDPRADRLLEAVVEHATERETELRVRSFLAIAATVRSAADADDRFGALLADTRDDETEFSLRVRVNWVTTLLGRADHVRAVRALRAADERAERIDSNRGRGYVRLHWARLHDHLGDHDRQDRELERVRELLDRHELPGVHHLYVRTMMYRAIDRSDWDAFQRWSSELDRLGNGPLAAPLFKHMRRIDAVDTALARQSASEALAAVRELRLASPQTFHTRMYVAALEARALTRARQLEAAGRVVGDALRYLLSEAPELPPTTVLTRSLELRDAALACEDVESANLALESAAEASLRRIVELDDQVRSDGIVHPDDRALLVQARQRFVRERRDLAASVAERLASPLDSLGQAVRDLLARSAERWIVCAWCRAVLSEAGDWLPAGHLLDDPHTASVTHGICETCRTGLVHRPCVSSI